MMSYFAGEYDMLLPLGIEIVDTAITEPSLRECTHGYIICTSAFLMASGKIQNIGYNIL